MQLLLTLSKPNTKPTKLMNQMLDEYVDSILKRIEDIFVVKNLDTQY